MPGVGSTYRQRCYTCRRAIAVCLCEKIRPFNSRTRFVILMHPKEARKEGSGTGRLCHLALKNSQLHIGVDFSHDPKVNDLIADPDFRSVILFPSKGAIDILEEGFQALGDCPTRPLQIFVVDGTWRLAGKILRLSENLHPLPAVKFSPRQASNSASKNSHARSAFPLSNRSTSCWNLAWSKASKRWMARSVSCRRSSSSSWHSSRKQHPLPLRPESSSRAFLE